MEEIETELTCSEQETLGAEFITVELDTQPIEYVVKWAEAGSKFTIACVKNDFEEAGCFNSDELVKIDPDETFFVPYESVYPDCDDASAALIATHEEEVGSEMNFVNHAEAENSQLFIKEEEEEEDDEEEEEEEEDASNVSWEKETQSQSQTYNCNFCGKSYSHYSSLARHLHKHSEQSSHTPLKEFGKLSNSKKSLQCNLCGLKCNGKRLLAIHRKSHKAKRLHMCNMCGKSFNHSSSLSRHRLIHKKALDANTSPLYPTETPAPILNHHTFQSGNPPTNKTASPCEQEQLYQCAQCNRGFNHPSSLSKHQVTHVKELLDLYSHDSDALDKPSDLKIRLKLCSSNKANYYTLCKKNKRRKGSKKRLCLPNEERPYPCRMCDKRFSHTNSLSRHEHTHEGEKSFTCGVCKKSFIRLSNLKQHQQTHATGKLYQCQHCGKTFVHSSSFSRHKKVHAKLIMMSAGVYEKEDEEEEEEEGHCEEELVIDEEAPLEFESE